MKTMSFDFMKTEAFKLVFEFFDRSYSKTMEWFQSKNAPLCGGVSPIEMVNMGRYDKLLKYIKNALSENKETL